MSAASNAHTPGGRRGLTRRLSLVFLLAGALLATAATPSEAFASSYAMTPGGLPVTVTTTVPDENATATFSGIAGKRISLRMTDVTIGPSTCCSAKVSILKPDGKALVAAAFVGTNGGFIDTKTLPTTGTYTILVDPQKAATGSMTLTLYDVPADDVDTIAPGGAAVTVTAAVPGQNARLTFAGAAGQRVSLLVGSTCCSVQLSIARPNGSRLTSAFFGTAGGFVDTQTLPQAGTYTISVDPQGFATGDVTLTLYDVPPDVVGTITPGGPEVTATTTVPGQNAKLTFPGTKDQRVSLKVGPTCCVTRVSIVDPFGNTLVAPTFIGTFGGFVDTKTLTATGTYTIVIDPQNGATGATTFTLYDIPPDPIASITPGGPAVTVTTTVPGQNAKLTFSGTTGQRISLGVGPTCCSTNISILSADGSTLVTPKSISTAGGFVDPFTLPATGTYTIVVDPQGLAIGSTTFTLYDVAPDVTGTITAGGPDVTVTTTVPGQNAKLTFSGTTGQRISLGVGPTCCSTNVSILNPDGTTLVAPMFFGTFGGFIETKTLPATGTYTIVVDVFSSATGSVTLALYDVPPDVTRTIVPGGPPVTVTVTTPGQNASLTFGGTAGQIVSLEIRPTCCVAKVSITNPDGTTLVAPTFVGTSGAVMDAKTLPATGTYTIVVDPQSSATGDITLSLYDVPPNATGTITAGGPPVSVTTTTPGQNAAVTFTGTAGQQISLRVGTPCCLTKVSIVSPDTSTLVVPTTFATGGGFIDTRTLPATGTYTIVVDPQESATGEYTLTLYDVPADATGTATMDGPKVTVTTTTPGQNATVTFSGSALDGLKLTTGPFNCCHVRISIVNPDGSTLTAPTGFNPDGGSLFTRLPLTGTYTIFVDPTGPNVGDVHLGLEVDNTAPAVPVLSISESSVDSHVVGNTFYYRPTGSGSSFTVNATTSDGDSGVQRVEFPGLSGGFTPTSVLADTSSPFARSYSWSSGATYDGALNLVTAYDKVGNVASAAFAVSRDADPPVTVDDTAAIGSSWKNTSQVITLTASDVRSGVAATYYTTDGSSPTTASPSGTSAMVTAEGVYTAKYFSVDNVGNVEDVKAADTQIRIDKTRPSSATLNPLASVIKNGQILTGSGADALSGVASISYYYCSGGNCTPSTLIGSSSTGPSYSVTWSSQPADGTYQVLARVFDAAGNSLDSAKRTVTIDNTSPNTTITKSPANPTNQTSATFEFTSSETGSTFECRLDGSAWTACTTPKSHTALTAGSHTFEVRASDPVGNTDATPATYTWTIDLTPPDTTITATPPVSTNQTSASFSFSSTESGTFQCSLDGGTFATCATPKSYTGLAQGSHTFAVRAVDAAGNIDGSPATYTWTIDTTAADTTITSGPTSPTNQTNATFSFSSTESGSTFECALDGAAFASCASPASYAGLAPGSHTFRVRATDLVGNVDASPASRTWTVDLTAPETTITVTPANPTNATSATFSFTSTESGSTFECRLDSGGFAPCTSPTTYSGLGVGSHTFEVKATDPAGNTDATPASYTWTIDLTPPDTTITAGPASPTNATSASFSFTSTETASTFECALDGAAFATCASPKSYTGLAQGSHTFAVRAVDAAGNTDATPASRAWVVDTAAPETTITSAPANPTNQTSATFEFAGEATATFECRLDGAAFAACTSPIGYTELAVGAHTFEVRATDSAGNTDATPASRTWIIDLTAPETTINATPANPTNQASASFSFSSTESGSTFECQLDAGGFGPCTSPRTYSGLAAGDHTFDVRATDPAGNTDATSATYTWTIDLTPPDTTIASGPASPTKQTSASFTFVSTETGTFQCSLDGGAFASCPNPKSYAALSDGSHTFSVRAVDSAGNTDATPASWAWTVDAAAPATTLTSAPADPTNETSAAFAFTSSEGGSTFECQLDAGGYAPCTSATSYTGLAAGAHTFEVRATDAAGNTDPTPASRTWTIDLTAPETTIASAPADPTNETSASFAFSSSESGSAFECRLDGGAWTPCTSTKSYTGLATGAHSFDVRAIDPAGNTDPTPATSTWTIDTTPPETTIGSGPADPTNQTSATFAFTASDPAATFECRLDTGAWTGCTSTKSYTGLAPGMHTFDVRATDAVGNTEVTPASWAWTVDTAAPATTITSAPADPTNETSAAFEFTSSEGGSTFECQLDAGGYAPCTSATSYTGLAAGSHTFQVKATDPAGNVDTTASTHTWSVDLTPPETAIASGPADPTNQTSATFAFSSSESGSSFECSLDDAAFASCTPPVTYGGLAAGSHRFEVRATDAAGNTDATRAVRTWTIDVTAPTAPSIDSPPDGTIRSTGDFTVSGTAEAGSTVELFEGPTSIGSATAGSTGAWSKGLTGVAQGSHTYTARATDPAGNTSAASNAVTVTVDLTAPNTKIDAGPAGSTSSTTATFAFSADDTAATFECSLDGAPFTACASPILYSSLAETSHTFQVRATDAAGNTDGTPASRTWRVDVTAPTAPVLTSPVDGSTNTTGSVTVAGTAEAGSIVEVFDGATSRGVTVADASGNWSKPLTGVADGSHTYKANATDTASNTSPVSNSVTITVDATAPQTTIDTGPPPSTNQTDAAFTFSSSEAASTFECRLDAGGWTSCTSSHSYSGLAVGSHTFEVRATDSAGNTDATAASRTWIVDTAAPETTISSAPIDPTVETDASFTFTSTEPGSTFECRLDAGGWTPCTSPHSYTSLEVGSHTFDVRATDSAGNTDPTAATHTWNVT